MPHRQLNAPKANIEIFDINENGFKVRSDVYAHAVHFNLPDDVRFSDEFFDLLPMQEYAVKIENMTLKSDTFNITALSV